MTYVTREEIPDVETYLRLRREAGLSPKSPEAATLGLRNSLFSVVVHCEGIPVGMGRVVGDGGCFFEVVDIAVVPAHQKKGLGDLIMRTIMGYLRVHAPVTALVNLLAGHGTTQFYQRYGFELAALPDHAGMFQRMV